MVQQYVDSVNREEQEAKVGLATLTRDNLRQLIRADYRGKIWLSHPQEDKRKDIGWYELRDGHFYGAGFIIRIVKRREVGTGDIPFEDYSYGRLAHISTEVEKAVESLSP